MGDFTGVFIPSLDARPLPKEFILVTSTQVAQAEL